MSRLWTSMILVGVAAVLATTALADDRARISEAWQKATLLAPDSNKEFASLLRRAGGATVERELRFGYALTLLVRPPSTEANWKEAKSDFESLAAGDDDVGLASQYFLGRIAQNYQRPADFNAAATHYRELIARRPTSYWGQLAIGKLAVLSLYCLPSPSTAQRISLVEALLPQAKPETGCELHLLIADAGLFHRQSEANALSHLLAADALVRGGVRLVAGRRSDMLVQTIDLSIRLHQLPQAEAYVATLAQEFPRDWRLYAVREILRAASEGRTPPVL